MRQLHRFFVPFTGRELTKIGDDGDIDRHVEILGGFNGTFHLVDAVITQFVVGVVNLVAGDIQGICCGLNNRRSLSEVRWNEPHHQ